MAERMSRTRHHRPSSRMTQKTLATTENSELYFSSSGESLCVNVRVDDEIISINLTAEELRRSSVASDFIRKKVLP